MKKRKGGFRAKISNKIDKHKHSKKYLTGIGIFVVVVLSLSVGYVCGTYRFYIEGALAPVFGKRAHSGEINLGSVQEVYSKLVSNYDGNIDQNKLIEGAKKGLVDAVGDVYTVYMDSDDAKDFGETLTGNIGGGIGAVISVRNERIVIGSVLKDNPAIRVGLQAGDVILKINDQSIEGWSVDKAVSHIRGKEGTTVKLSVLRASEQKDFTITRAIVNNPSVSSEIKNEIGILTLTRFDGQTTELARKAAQDFKNNNVKGVVLDLRNNGGGYLDAARGVAGIWLSDQVVVTERKGEVTTSMLRSGKNPILNGIPTVVLVNGESASASEIVAGALQDHKVATVVGVQSFGKGSVQQLFDFIDGSELKVTVARWYTPNGKNITKEGIIPDKIINMTQSDVNNDIDPQMDEANIILGS